jgi:hypothetical protein
MAGVTSPAFSGFSDTRIAQDATVIRRFFDLFFNQVELTKNHLHLLRFIVPACQACRVLDGSDLDLLEQPVLDLHHVLGRTDRVYNKRNSPVGRYQRQPALWLISIAARLSCRSHLVLENKLRTEPPKYPAVSSCLTQIEARRFSNIAFLE